MVESDVLLKFKFTNPAFFVASVDDSAIAAQTDYHEVISSHIVAYL